MKSKNNDTSRITEKSSTFFSSIATKVRTIRASSSDYWRENRREIFLALVLLTSLFLVPLLLCVTASASEVDSEYVDSYALPDLPTSDSGYDVQDRPFASAYPTWHVFFDSVGGYSTPAQSGVYAYLTSVNSPKASTRSASVTTSDYNYLTSRIFVFKNVNKPDSEQKRATIKANFFDLPTSLGNHSPNYYTTFTFSNATDIAINVSYVEYSESPSFTGGGIRIISSFPIPSNDLTLSVEEIFDHLHTIYSPDDPLFASDTIITGITLRINLLDGFDNVSPNSSYIDVKVRESRTQDYNEYLKSMGYTLLDVESAYSESWQTGYYVGRNDGRDEGYEEGYVQGVNVGEASNFDPGWFVRAVDAFLNIRLFQYTYAGTPTDFTLGTIFSIAVGGTALLWFIKIFAGG